MILLSAKCNLSDFEFYRSDVNIREVQYISLSDENLNKTAILTINIT